jgi:hypothetical protein
MCSNLCSATATHENGADSQYIFAGQLLTYMWDTLKSIESAASSSSHGHSVAAGCQWHGLGRTWGISAAGTCGAVEGASC